ncbi:MAG: hypothetical protein ACOC0B_01470 [bacterium]
MLSGQYCIKHRVELIDIRALADCTYLSLRDMLAESSAKLPFERLAFSFDLALFLQLSLESFLRCREHCFHLREGVDGFEVLFECVPLRLLYIEYCRNRLMYTAQLLS